jgi:PAS domain S-box-containing protein
VKDKSKAQDQLINELVMLRQRVSELEAAQAQRKPADEALRESEERFRSAFGDAAIGMALVSTDGHFLQVNRSLCEILGYSEHELLDKTFQAITHPEDLDVSLGYLRTILAGEIRSFQLETRYYHKLNHVVWILLSVSLIRDTEGHPLYFISQMQDITERQRAEEALRESEERYRDLVQELDAIVWEGDVPTMGFTFVS